MHGKYSALRRRVLRLLSAKRVGSRKNGFHHARERDGGANDSTRSLSLGRVKAQGPLDPGDAGVRTINHQLGYWFGQIKKKSKEENAFYRLWNPPPYKTVLLVV